MSGIHLIMPMGGAGSRFDKEGFDLPKPLIKIQGYPFFYWSVRSILGHTDVCDITFVALEEHIRDYHIDEEIKRLFPNSHIISIPNILPGPVYTCIEGAKRIADKNPVVFNDCDHAFGSSAFYQAVRMGIVRDGLLTFKAANPAFSYVRFDESGNVIGTIEKKVVSKDAICGAYVFSSAQGFLDYAKQYIKECPYDECFMSGIYNTIHKCGGLFDVYPLDWHCEFGTPEEYREVLNNEHFFDKVVADCQ